MMNVADTRNIFPDCGKCNSFDPFVNFIGRCKDDLQTYSTKVIAMGQIVSWLKVDFINHEQ